MKKDYLNKAEIVAQRCSTALSDDLPPTGSMANQVRCCLIETLRDCIILRRLCAFQPRSVIIGPAALNAQLTAVPARAQSPVVQVSSCGLYMTFSSTCTSRDLTTRSRCGIQTLWILVASSSKSHPLTAFSWSLAVAGRCHVFLMRT